jgi:hypothetical protein
MPWYVSHVYIPGAGDLRENDAIVSSERTEPIGGKVMLCV